MRRALNLLVLAALGSCGNRAAEEPVRVAAAASLRELLTRTARDFEEAHPGARIELAFDASSSLARQIDASGQFDLFLSADEETMERVGSKLAPGSKVALLRNRLVMVGRQGVVDPPRRPEDLLGGTGAIAVAGPAVPAGKLARAVLARRGLLDPLSPRLANADNVRGALALVESGRAEAGFVYLTDARIAQRATQLWVADDPADPVATLWMALIEGSSEQASRFHAPCQ